MGREMAKASGFAASICDTIPSTMRHRYGTILHPGPKSIQGGLASWRSVLAAITRHARQRLSSVLLAASPGERSGITRKSGVTGSSGWRAPTRRRCLSPQHISWVLNATSQDDALRRLEPFKLD